MPRPSGVAGARRAEAGWSDAGCRPDASSASADRWESGKIYTNCCSTRSLQRTHVWQGRIQLDRSTAFRSLPARPRLAQNGLTKWVTVHRFASARNGPNVGLRQLLLSTIRSTAAVACSKCVPPPRSVQTNERRTQNFSIHIIFRIKEIDDINKTTQHNTKKNGLHANKSNTITKSQQFRDGALHATSNDKLPPHIIPLSFSYTKLTCICLVRILIRFYVHTYKSLAHARPSHHISLTLLRNANAWPGRTNSSNSAPCP